MSITLHPFPHVGALGVHGDFTDDLALQFDGGLDLLCGYYQYTDIDLQINSAGGQINALQHMLSSVQRWRALGRRFSTTARLRAGSAAAFLLALGDVGSRSASGSTALHFHGARVEGKSAMVTADAAARLGAWLQGTDQAHLERLVEHQVHGFGGWHGVASEGAARCRHLLRVHQSGARTSRSAAGVSQDLISPRSLTVLAKSFAQCLQLGSSEPYSRLLSRRFAEDRPMFVSEAWAWCLIDRVPDRPHLHLSPDTSTIGADHPGPLHQRPSL